MPAFVLATLALVQVSLMYLPPLTWSLWLAHFVAIETCLLAAATGLAAAYLADSWPVRIVGLVTGLAGLAPAFAAVPGYVREGHPFSLVDWFTGGGVPQVRVEHDVDLDGLAVDVYHPTGSHRPFVLVVHGGSWRAGDKGEAPRVSRALAEAGYVVLDLRYRLAPFPAAIADVKCALAAVRARADALGIDPDRGALLGRSAGGEIALVAAYSDDRFVPCGTPATIRAVVSVYAPTDLAWDHDNPYVPDVVDGTAAIEAYLGGPPAQWPSIYSLATPQAWLDHPVPPTLLVHGTAERCVRPLNAERLRDALEAAGQRVRTLFLPFADHGFDRRPGGFAEQLTRGVILEFLRDHL